MDTLHVNLFGSPGSGKSTGASYIFSMLKLHGIVAELVTEFVKDKVWEKSNELVYLQPYISGNQIFRQYVLDGQVEVVITDSPILFGLIYNQDVDTKEEYDRFLVKFFNKHNNINYLITRNKPYVPIGRTQSKDKSDKISMRMRHEIFDKYSIPYVPIAGTEEGYNIIVDTILYKMNKTRNDRVDINYVGD